MPELSFRGQIYRLRAGSPMPVRGGDFVLHTFMAEISDVEMIACTETLPSSSEFRGQGGNLVSASFTRLNVKGGTIFSGKKVYSPRYVDEDELDNI
jgi:hypothetical protein